MATTLFHYDPTLPTDRDWVRYYVGDTSADHAEVDDRELDALLAEEPAPDPLEDPTPAEVRSYRKTIASRAASAIAGKHAQDVDVSFDNQRSSMSAKFAQFTKRAEQLKLEAAEDLATAVGVSGGMIPRGALVIKVGGTVKGRAETLAAMQQVMPIVIDQLDSDARASAFMVTRTAQKSYLSGPRPTRLGVVTNRLRGSLNEGDPDFIFDVERQALRVTVKVGTNVSYASSHEYGATIKPKKAGGYLAIPTALAKTPAGALKNQYSGGLRSIVGLFFLRSKHGGGLFAAVKSPATGRQRRSGFSVLFALVKQSVIPKRPFLGPALRDSTQWITDRFAQGMRRAEQQITALVRGR